MTHQPKHQYPVQSDHRHQREDRAVQQLRELLRFSVECQNVADEARDLVALAEVVVHVPIVLMNPLLAAFVELVVKVLICKCDLDLVVDSG